jgi:ornithine carbamoyltransferase
VTPLATRARSNLRGRDFLDIADVTAEEVRGLLVLAARMKRGEWSGMPLEGMDVALIFQKPSMRTRVSFEVGIRRLGGHAVVLSDAEIGLGRRESVADVARVLERYTEAIVARLYSHDDLAGLAEASRKPVINALTDRSHPCQVLADLVTLEESLEGISGRRVAFVGDGNNVASSLIEAAGLLGFSLVVVTPPRHFPPEAVLATARRLGGGSADVRVTSDLAAIEGVDAVYTDVWTSMGQESESELRRREFAEYQVNDDLMRLAPGAVFLHCLPAHRGEEVDASVIDSARSAVFEQSENRMWAQMALLAALFGEPLQ